MLKQLFIFIIRFYQKIISPLKPPTCRFYPTCSHYGLDAVKRFGAIKGGFLAIVRILKCHPFHPGGVDLVPEEWPPKKKTKKRTED
ncbi:putative membrane protein insertion efficiency factor [Bacillus ectoiniformans]|uniref:membrane protein insertion efficiency factor YidD n=1 Tax=Bacillus ectoiniformans TaxID=1494429 RepID=UPI0019575DD9|nr:membrane protein insertion efficiency factor YidD [Bacillus ectoiniformans]MBM7649724.1 putative membrane protein insertion efficiency factor [Bacillus ectoiniformans]